MKDRNWENVRPQQVSFATHTHDMDVAEFLAVWTGHRTLSRSLSTYK